MSSPLIDTVIGMVFVFFVVALASSAIVEAIAGLLNKRAKYLLRGLRDLLHEATGTQPTSRGFPWSAERQTEAALYRTAIEAPVRQVGQTSAGTETSSITVKNLFGHPLISPLKSATATRKRVRNPSYLPTRTVATALVDILCSGPSGAPPTSDFVARITNLPEGSAQLKGALLALAAGASGDVQRFTSGVEEWLDAQMERVSGAYKRWSKRCLVVAAFGVATFFHADAIGIAHELWTTEPLRTAVVGVATSGKLCELEGTVTETKACVDRETAALRGAGLDLGPSYLARLGQGPNPLLDGMWLLLGLSITAAAATVGAPVWFDVLNRVGSLRNDVKSR